MAILTRCQKSTNKMKTKNTIVGTVLKSKPKIIKTEADRYP